MNYLSVCSGIEAATVAWHSLGWSPVAFSEIEKFPSAVLKHHYPHVPNLGDMTKWKDWPDADVDVLVGGTPCQSFSVAGLRQGLADPRGNLCLTFLAIADRYRPEWVLWENVPGVLSSDGGRDFGAFLGGLGQLGYGWSYRVLDAQYVRVDGFGRAVPQRRRRVFVVGHLGNWRRAAAVLFERESLYGNTAPRRQAGQRTTPTISCRPSGGGGLGTDFGCDGGLIAAARMVAFGEYIDDGSASTLKQRDYKDATDLIAHSLRAEGFDASEDGTGRGTPLVPINVIQYGGPIDMDGFSQAVAFQPRFARNDRGAPDEIAAPLTAEAGRTGKGDSAQCVAFAHQAGGDHTSSGVFLNEHSPTLQRSQTMAVQQGWAVRRLTPRECERLQGFPDDYTAIPKAADGPRYKALGNSMAVNVMRWIGHRIAMVAEL